MICQPCRDNEHRSCPEQARKAKITSKGIIGMPLLDELALLTGQWCDCQHAERIAELAPGSRAA